MIGMAARTAARRRVRDRRWTSVHASCHSPASMVLSTTGLSRRAHLRRDRRRWIAISVHSEWSVGQRRLQVDVEDMGPRDVRRCGCSFGRRSTSAASAQVPSSK